MKKWSVIASLSVAAAGAAALGLLSLRPGKDESKAKPSAKPAAAAAPAKDLKTGSYSFISGYQDAATVELTLRYDPEKVSFAVAEEDFLVDSSDSHVALVYSDDFNLQLEYAAYYAGEDFAGLKKHLEEKYQSLAPAGYGKLDGLRFIDGDAIGFCFPIPGDSSSYLHVTAFKGPENDDELAELPAHPALAALLSTVDFAIQR
ncbi:MAG: hypothetical protein J5927_03690 [Oscillospiraceae bacterium]|nr:hypothetical protein [Oscillospiraceae bacterium]